MKFFIDTANLDLIKDANGMGMVDGVTTNPSLIAKEDGVFEEIIANICKEVEGPVSPGVSSGEQGSRPRSGEGTSRVMVMIDGRLFGKPGQIGRGLARVTKQRQVPGRPGIEQEDEDVLRVGVKVGLF